MMAIDPDALWPELEQIGEDEVRKTLATDRIHASDKRPLVVEWIRRKEQERYDSSSREQIAIAREAAASARNAADAARAPADEAREANRLARQANTTAKIAMAIVAIAVITASQVKRRW